MGDAETTMPHPHAPSGQRAGPLFPAAPEGRDLPLLLIALAAAGSSIAALLLHAAGWIRMPYTVSFVTLPGMVLLACLGAWARRARRALLLNRLVVGTLAGMAGLLAYDGTRWLVQVALPMEFDAFYSMAAFGNLMTGYPHDASVAIASGWAYHVSNGLTFGIAYALLAGPARWYWGLAWGLVLELGMVTVYPSLFRLSSLQGFLVVSVVGHAAYGGTLGAFCERYARRSAP
jgi:hypothetical protein